MIVLGRNIFEDMVLWVFVSEDGGFGVFMEEVTQLGCEREGELRRGWAHWASPRVSRGDYTKVSGRKTRAGEVYPERTVGTLYQSVSPGDSTGADGAGVYWVRVGMNVTVDEKEHKDKN